MCSSSPRQTAPSAKEKHSPVLHDPKLLPVLLLSLEAVTHGQHAVVQFLAIAPLLVIDP